MLKKMITEEMLRCWPGLGAARKMVHDDGADVWRLEFEAATYCRDNGVLRLKLDVRPSPRVVTVELDDQAWVMDVGWPGEVGCYIPGAFEPFYDNRLLATAQKVLPRPEAWSARMVLPGQEKAPEWPFMVDMYTATGDYQAEWNGQATFTLKKPSEAGQILLLMTAHGEGEHAKALETLSVKLKTLIRAPLRAKTTLLVGEADYRSAMLLTDEANYRSVMLLVIPLVKTTRWMVEPMLRRQKLVEVADESEMWLERELLEQELKSVEAMLPTAWRVWQTKQSVALMVAGQVKQFCYDRIGVRDAMRLRAAVQEMMRAMDAEILG